MGKLNFLLNTPHKLLFFFNVFICLRDRERLCGEAFCIPQDKCMNSCSSQSRLLPARRALNTE